LLSFNLGLKDELASSPRHDAGIEPRPRSGV
jgi:hypothetical protein